MLTRLKASNYKSLGKEVDVQLGAFSVLVGQNGSGKSNVLDAVAFVADTYRLGLPGAIANRGGIQAVRRAGHPHGGTPRDLTIEIHLRWSDGHASYGFCLGGDREEDYKVKWERARIETTDAPAATYSISAGTWQGPDGLQPQIDRQNLALKLVGADHRFHRLATAVGSVAVYSILPDALRTPNKYDQRRPMDREGSNWASVLRDQPHETWKPDLLAVLDKLTNGDIDDVKVSQIAGFLVVQFHHASSNKWRDAGQESDGTLRVAGILISLLQTPAVGLLGIEEPELTVHPGVIPLLVDFLREASSRSQMIVTTHSPELLDLVDIANVQVVSRHEGETTVALVSERQQELVKQRLLTLGELIRSEGIEPAQISLSFEP